MPKCRLTKRRDVHSLHHRRHQCCRRCHRRRHRRCRRRRREVVFHDRSQKFDGRSILTCRFKRWPRGFIRVSSYPKLATVRFFPKQDLEFQAQNEILWRSRSSRQKLAPAAGLGSSSFSLTYSLRPKLGWSPRGPAVVGGSGGWAFDCGYKGSGFENCLRPDCFCQLISHFKIQLCFQASELWVWDKLTFP